jgi:1-deoxy-D-xylulose-5-phosphate reductoisomerase
MRKRLSILGSTGSIGLSTLKVVDHFKEDFEIVALAVRSNLAELLKQVEKYRPKMVAIFDPLVALEAKKYLNIPVIPGIEGLIAAATLPETDMVLQAMTGTVGLLPTIKAIIAKKDIAIANKETLVAGGTYVTDLARLHGVKLLPVDSEHSALFQCLVGENNEDIHKLILTASGGPFLKTAYENLATVTPEEALCHPTWKMGPKVTIDSSTLMNKGLEVIEACILFGVPIDKIEVVIHPKSLVHSMVEFKDGSIKTQMNTPNMIGPIQYALHYPERKETFLKRFDTSIPFSLEFYPPDFKKFKCLDLAFEASRQGGTLPCFMNGANDILVDRFLKKEISWVDIGIKLEKLMTTHSVSKITSFDMILSVDEEARSKAYKI